VLVVASVALHHPVLQGHPERGRDRRGRTVSDIQILPDYKPGIYPRHAGRPRVAYIVDDGRRYLNAFQTKKFDLIAIDPLREHFAGHKQPLLGRSPGAISRSPESRRRAMRLDEGRPHRAAYGCARVPYADLYLNELMIGSNAPSPTTRPTWRASPANTECL